MKTLDVVVVNYRTPGDLADFIESYLRYPFADKSTLHIVNNAPEDEDYLVSTAAFLERGPVTLTWNEDNIGYARAVNDAASRGVADTLAIFNADCKLTDGLLTACSEKLWSTPGVGILGPRQVDERNRFTHAGIFGDLQRLAHRGWLEQDRGQYSDTRDAVTISGSAYFIKRDVWDELTTCPTYQRVAPDATGAFLPTQHYYEETWCSYHAQAHGHRVLYYGAVSMIHKWHKASPVAGIAEQKWMSESREYFREACDHHGITHD